MGRTSNAERLYRLMLRGYPADFRRACEDELVADFLRDRQRPRYRGMLGKVRFWRHTFADWARTAWSERRSAAGNSNAYRQGAGGSHAFPPPPPARRPNVAGLRHAARSLLRDPAYSVVAIVTLAVGMSATTVVFSLVNGLLLTPLPLPQPERLVQVEQRDRMVPDVRMASYGSWNDLTAAGEAFEELAIFAYSTRTLTGVDSAVRLRGREVSDNFFAALGVSPAMGRVFQPQEFEDGQHQVVVIAHQLWVDAFGADPEILGRAIQLDATPYTVVGIMGPGVDFPFGAALWVPLREATADCWRRCHRYRLTGRLVPGATLAQAQETLDVMGTRIAQEFPQTNENTYFTVYPLLDEYVGETRPALRLLAGAVGLVLLIACVNIASLALARSNARRQEIAMRRALGASRLQLVALVLSEGLVLGLVGGIVGLAATVLGLETLLALAADAIPRAENVGLSGAVFAFAGCISVAAGLLVSLFPLIREARTGAAALVTNRVIEARAGILGRRGLVVGQLAMAVVLVAGAGLLGRSLVRLSAVQTGVVAENVLTMSMALPRGKYAEATDVAAFFAQTQEQIDALPGIDRSAATLTLPADPRGWRNPLTVRSRPLPESEWPLVSYVVVSPGYFEAMGIPLLEGRTFAATETTEGAPVAVLNRSAAELYWAEGSALDAMVLGRHDNEDSNWARVIGVVEDVRQSLHDPPLPEVYVPMLQDSNWSYVLVARTRGEPGQYAAALRDLLREVDADIPVTAVMPLEDRFRQHSADTRFNAVLMSTFAGIALALAAVGVYGVLSYSVTLRRREFGVRAAIGATRGVVLRMVMREALIIGVVAVAAGIAAAMAATRLLSGLLFGIDGGDPATLAGVGAIVVLVTVAAALAPAWRAASADPLSALRSD